MNKLEINKILKTDMTTVDHKHLCNAKTYNAINGIIYHINETMNEGEFDEVQALMIYKSVIDAIKVPIGQIKESLKINEDIT